MNMFGNKNTTNNSANDAISVSTVWTETPENAERKSAKDYKSWLRGQIVWYQNELADVEAFLRGEQDDVGETNPTDE
jgi:hypothetical protein